MLVEYDVYTISDIIWNDWNGEWAGAIPNVLCILNIDSITNLVIIPPKIPLF